MRFKTFRTLAIVGAVGAGAAGLYGLSRLGGSSEPPPAPFERPARAIPQAEPPAAVAPAAEPDASPDALRPMDREILARVAEGIPGGKGKDAIKGRAWKVNLYQDEGHSRVNRLKIDLDRDEKWDEKWTFLTDGGQEVVKRQVAPNDDEAYTEEYRLEGGRWRKK